MIGSYRTRLDNKLRQLIKKFNKNRAKYKKGNDFWLPRERSILLIHEPSS